VNHGLLDTAGLAPVEAVLTSLAIGLLIGVERERNPAAKAGLRTFALTAVLGTVAALLGEKTGSPWIPAVGLALVGLAIISAYHNAPPEPDPGTTTVIALLIAYVLGAMCWFGESTLAVMLAVAATALLYFKPELHGLVQRVERRDLLSMLQFAALSLVILPILPDRAYGPYDALNPYRIWLMVVLVSGLSLAGYVAFRIVGTRHGLRLVGLFGGLVSSTATTLAYSRHAREGGFAAAAAAVILIANLVVLVRIAVLSAVVSPAVIGSLTWLLAPALAVGSIAVAVFWRRSIDDAAQPPLPPMQNPTELRASLGFGLLFAVVLFMAAWLSDRLGARGLYAVALVSGLTDVDAITLSALQLLDSGRIGTVEAVTTVGIALGSNTLFKLGLVLAVGGAPLARQVILPMAAAAAAGAAGLAALWAA
jgi:uncharacterized membrane protein (DUF4010 family)